MRHVRSSRDGDGLYWKVVGRVKYATYRNTQAVVGCHAGLSCGLAQPEYFGRRERLHASHDEMTRQAVAPTRKESQQSTMLGFRWKSIRALAPSRSAAERRRTQVS